MTRPAGAAGPAAALALTLAMAVTGACGAAAPRPGAGAVGYVPPAPAGSAVTAGVPPTTVALEVGGVPVVSQRLVSGVTPARSPAFTVRGTTWPPKKKKPIPPVPLAAGGYEAQLLVYPETDFKTRQPYRCSAAVSLVVPGGRALMVTAPQASGTTARTFVVPRPTTAVPTGVGPVGCDWVLVLFPA